MKKKNIEISRPLTGVEEWKEIKESILSGWLTQGPKVRKFEEMFSQYHRAKYSLATTSCTTALHLALLANNIGKGDEVIVPAFTWVSTANVVLYCGAKLVLADVDKKTFNICISDVLSKITGKTKAVIPVHLFGLCVDIDKLKKGLPKTVKIIEDAACAAGAIYKNKFAGTLGDAAAFSFHPRKSITTGEGGMLTSNNKKFIIKAEKLRNHGAEISEEQRHKGPKPYLLPDFNFLGYNYRMTDIQGSVGIAQIRKLNRIIKERSKWAKFYRRELSKIEWILCPSEPKVGRHSWQAFVMYINPESSPAKRNDIMDFLEKKGISTRPGTHAIHTLNYYAKKFNYKPKNFPNAFDCQNNTIALPLHNFMSKSDYEFVVKCIKEIK